MTDLRRGSTTIKCDNCCDIVIPNIKAKMQKQIEARANLICFLEEFFYPEDDSPADKQRIVLMKAITDADKEANR